MSEMVERVARALCAIDMLEVLRSGMVASAGTPLQAALATPAAIDLLWPNYRDQARAAIEAMREPTEAMVSADMALGGYGYGDDVYSADPAEIYSAMISAALAE